MKFIYLSQGHFATVDDEDHRSLSSYRWQVTFGAGCDKPYAKGLVGGRFVRMHRHILQAPAGMVVDHINGDTLDNRRCNIRLATFLQNTHNRKGNKGTITGRKGVVARERGGYQATISIEGKVVNLGRFKTIDEAGDAYDKAARETHGEFCHVSSQTRSQHLIR